MDLIESGECRPLVILVNYGEARCWTYTQLSQNEEYGVDVGDDFEIKRFIVRENPTLSLGCVEDAVGIHLLPSAHS